MMYTVSKEVLIRKEKEKNVRIVIYGYAEKITNKSTTEIYISEII